MKDTHEKITEAAFRLFLARGYDGTSMVDIVAASKMSKGAVYFHFRDKEALHAAAIERFFIRFLDEGTTSQSDNKDLGELLRGLCAGYKSMARNIARITPDLATYYRFLMSVLPVVRPAVKERIGRARAAIVEAVKKEQASGRISSAHEPNVVADQAVALIEGTGLICVMENRSDVAEVLDRNLDAFVNLLRAVRGTEPQVNEEV